MDTNHATGGTPTQVPAAAARRRRRRRSKTRTIAFTLVEILIVVVILGILASIVVPQFASATQEASKTATFDQLQRLRRSLAIYYATNNSRYPTIEEGEGTWGEFIVPGSSYMREPAVNHYVGGPNKKVIVFGTGPDAGYQATHGWIYDPGTGGLWAGSHDAEDRPYPQP